MENERLLELPGPEGPAELAGSSVRAQWADEGSGVAVRGGRMRAAGDRGPCVLSTGTSRGRVC